jgi:hypothetical protein
VTLRRNYIIPKDVDYIIDLRFEFPYSFYSGRDLSFGTLGKHKQELKIAGDNMCMLGLTTQTMSYIHFPHSYMDLQYAIYLD